MSEIAEIPAQIDPETEQAIEEALFLYFSGRIPKIADALTKTAGISVGTYYGLRQTNLAQLLEIQVRARVRAREETSDVQMVLDAESLLYSTEVQREAREAVKAMIPHLRAIVTREPQDVDTGEKDKEGNPKIKRIIPYPRDVASCAKILQELARGGVLPEGNIIPVKVTPVLEEKKEEERKPMLPMLGIGSDFSSITATKPDGTKFTATVVPGEVINVEEDDES